MGLNKRVKTGGAYYKGYEVLVSGSGDTTANFTESTGVINSVSIVIDTYVAGDTFKLEHVNAAGEVIALLADTIFNPGANVGTIFDFPAVEDMKPGDKLKLTYTAATSTALAVHIIVEYIGIRKTSST